MRTQFINLSTVTASAVALGAGGAVLVGMYVNSTASGTIKVYNSGTGASDRGKRVGGTITPAIGYHNLGSIDGSAGFYVVPTGNIDVTFHILSRD